MRGRQVFLVFLFSLLLLGFGFNQRAVESQTNGNLPKTEPTPLPNKPADVESVSLSREIVRVPCPPNVESDCDDQITVEATTVAKDTENDVLIYDYQVSAGKIIGTGAKVVWDLSDVQPGIYSIRVSVDDGSGVCGGTVTRTIKVYNCHCLFGHPPCICPTIDVIVSAEEIKAGETVTFTANIGRGTESDPIRYHWTISGGTILEGQNTGEIKVKTNGETAQILLTATVQILAEGLCQDCSNTASESVLIAKK